MARRTVPIASPVSCVSCVSDGSTEVISPSCIRLRSMAATWTYGCSGEDGSMITESNVVDQGMTWLHKVSLAISSHSRKVSPCGVM